MSRVKPTVWQAALRDAAKELGLGREDFRTERMATLRLALALQRQRWTQGTFSNSRDIIELLSEIESLRREAKDAAQTKIEVSIVSGVTGTYCCEFCGKRNFLKAGTYEPLKRPAALPAPDKPAPAEATQNDDKPVTAAPVAKPAVMYRQDVVSPFHAQVVNGISPPLKRFQSQLGGYPRSISPLSENPQRKA